MSKKAYRNTFLNAQKSIDLPSNLLNLRKENSQPRGHSLQLKATKLVDYSDRYFRTIPTPQLVGEKNNSKEKQVLYKRLTNIRGENKQIGHLSFSKMLSRMVIFDEDEVQDVQSHHYQSRMRQTINVTPVPTKVYHLNYSNPPSRAASRSIDYQQTKKPSRKLFKRYYLPSSETTQTFYLQTGDPNDKYIYQDGKKVQCKRIHNFYTSHMFRNGYGKCFKKTSEGFRL